MGWAAQSAPNQEPAGTAADLALSKNNYLFGVVSVDAQGHESPAVLPVVGQHGFLINDE